MQNTNELTPEMLKIIKDDVGFALGVLVGLKAIEPFQMRYAMDQAREALLRALNNIPSDKSHENNDTP